MTGLDRAEALPPIRAVVFDVGETIVDETRPWGEWADWLGIPRLTLFAVLGGAIARGDHRGVFDILRPGLDIQAESARRRAETATTWVNSTDLYPDALPAIAALREAGYLVGIAGNQPRETEQVIASLGIPLDLVASSSGLGVAKPDPAFFERIADELNLAPAAIAYVGDRVDNDVIPAAAAGMLSIFIRRGPWAYLQALDGLPAGTTEIGSLLELSAALAALEPGMDLDPDPDSASLRGSCPLPQRSGATPPLLAARCDSHGSQAKGMHRGTSTQLGLDSP